MLFREVLSKRVDILKYALAAVDVYDLPGHPRALIAQQKGGHFRNIIGLSNTFHWIVIAHGFFLLGSTQ